MMSLSLDKGARILFIGGISWICGDFLGFLGLINGWLAFFTFWSLGTFLSLSFAAQKVDCERRAILITSCDNELGQELSLHLDCLGFRIFACGGEGAQSLKEKASEKLHFIQMNVISDEEIEAAKQTVENLLPKNEVLWGIVNISTAASFGLIDCASIKDFEDAMAVNVFRMVKVVKKFLPLLRRSRGRLVNMSSMFGRFGLPMYSSNVSSKFAIEGITECLRQELKPSGIDVIVIEAGNLNRGTSLGDEPSVQEQVDEMLNSMDEETKNYYDNEKFRAQLNYVRTVIEGGEIEMCSVLLAVEEALTQKYPQARYQPTSASDKFRLIVFTHLPEWIYDAIYMPDLGQY